MVRDTPLIAIEPFSTTNLRYLLDKLILIAQDLPIKLILLILQVASTCPCTKCPEIRLPNLNDFLKGIKKILKSDGTVVIQFSAYLSKLISQREFDTIYHEHYSYFSFYMF